MYSYEEQCVMDLSDNYTLLYSFLGREVLDAFGVEGERAFREGTRRYGRDRGQRSREKHQAYIGTVLRCLVALNVTREEIEEMLSILERVVLEVNADAVR